MELCEKKLVQVWIVYSPCQSKILYNKALEDKEVS